MRRLGEGRVALLGEGRVALMLALLRVGLLAIVLVAEETVDRQRLDSERFELTFAVALAYALFTVGLGIRRAEKPPGGWVRYTALDLAFLGALTYESGGGLSQLRYTYSVIPVAVAFLGRTRQVAYASAATIGVYLLVAIAYPDAEEDPLPGEILVQGLFLGWRATLALALSVALTSRNERIDGLARARQALVAQLQGAEEGERRRLAEALHDEPVQNLLACSHELARVERGQPEALATAQEIVLDTTRQLRRMIVALHPRALEHLGVEAALRQVAEDLGRRASTPIAVHVEEGSSETCPDPALAFALGRELLANAAKHAQATWIALDLQGGEEGSMTITVSDNGVGFEPSDLSQALAEGHLGLASVRERVEAQGGRLRIDTALGHGAVVCVTLPANPPNVSSGQADRPSESPALS
jgi:two-component system, NarL family, sensor kinase